MSDLNTFSAKKPGYAAETISQIGTKAYDLLIRYQPTVEPRLPPSTVLELAGDLQSIGAAVPGAKVAHAEASVATATQLVLLAGGAKIAGSVRNLARRAKAPRDVKKAYGVGVRMNVGVVKDVVAVLTLIQNRAAANPAEAASLGITQEDLDAVKQALADIGAAFATTQKKRAAAPLSTKQRNRVWNRILYAAGRISAAGAAAFRGAPEIAKEFAAVAPPPLPKKKSARKPAGLTPAVKAAAPAPEPAKEAPATEAPAKAAPAQEAPAQEAPAVTPPAPATPA
jgi:hypothetical protein